MTKKNIFFATVVLLLAITGGAYAIQIKNTSPIYLYLNNPETGKCDIRDSDFLYKPVSPGTLRAVPILGRIGNSSEQCDTIYVIINH